ncbi:hypothetical protein LJR255_004294 [Pararhizobium sp. LjRoot255]|uniref:hypothetical protein n=1 Tax=Pararhizobium sp. LjRoot255 TaxID=3342298 RepID=UPI003ECCCB72
MSNLLCRLEAYGGSAQVQWQTELGGIAIQMTDFSSKFLQNMRPSACLGSEIVVRV